MLEVCRMTCLDHAKKTIVYRINLTVLAGEHVLIIGQAGSGKNVLASTLCGNVYPVEGEILRSGKIVLVTEDFPECELFTVREFIEISQELSGIKIDKNSIKEFLLKSRLWEKRDRKICHLTVHEKGYFLYAVAKSLDPDLIISEPYHKHLEDGEERGVFEKILPWLKKENVGVVCFSDHDICDFFDKRYLLRNGCLEEL